MIVPCASTKWPGSNTPRRATSMSPLDVSAPNRIPTVAMIMITRRRATRDPNAEFRKFTASFATPTQRSKVARPRIRRRATVSNRGSTPGWGCLDPEHHHADCRASGAFSANPRGFRRAGKRRDETVTSAPPTLAFARAIGGSLFLSRRHFGILQSRKI